MAEGLGKWFRMWGRRKQETLELPRAYTSIEKGEKVRRHVVIEPPVQIGLDKNGVIIYKVIIEKPEDYNFSPGQGSKFFIPIDKQNLAEEKDYIVLDARAGTVAERSRTLSFVSAPHENHLIFIFKDQEPENPSHFKKTLLSLNEGDDVFLREPTGEKVYPTPEEFDSKRIILIAGGIGITPFLSMFRHAAHRYEIDEGNNEHETFELLFINQTYEGIPEEVRNELKKYEEMNIVRVTHALTREQELGLSGGNKESAVKEFVNDLLNTNREASIFYLAGGERMTKNVKELFDGHDVEVRCTEFGYDE